MELTPCILMMEQDSCECIDTLSRYRILGAIPSLTKGAHEWQRYLIIEQLRSLKAFEAECKIGDKERERIVLEAAPEERKVEPTHPHFREVVDSIEAFFGADSDLVVEPILDAANLDGITLTVAQERSLYALGLVAEAKETP